MYLASVSLIIPSAINCLTLSSESVAKAPPVISKTPSSRSFVYIPRLPRSAIKSPRVRPWYIFS